MSHHEPDEDGDVVGDVLGEGHHLLAGHLRGKTDLNYLGLSNVGLKTSKQLWYCPNQWYKNYC